MTALSRRVRVAPAALLLLVAACRGERAAGGGSGDTGGTVIIATPADADVLLPPLSMSDQSKQITDMLFDHLAEIGDSLNTVGDRGFQPRLARRWTWSPDSLRITFELDPRARWHDGQPVRAADVRFTYRTYANPAVGSSTASLLANIDSVTADDSLHATFYFKKRTPLQFFDAVYQMAILPEHLLGKVSPADLKTSPFTRNPVGTGRFRFVRWAPGSLIEVVADTANYRGRPKIDRVIWSITPDQMAAVTKLETGEADVQAPLAPPSVAAVAKVPSLRVVPYQGLDYGYIGFNLRDRSGTHPHPLFGDRALRRALSMAVDRRTVVRNAFDSLAYVSMGPVVRAQATADTTIPQIPYDSAGAARLLDSLGWKLPAGGTIRQRNGRPLQFGIIVPTSSQNRMRLAVVVQDQFKRIGARMDIDALEVNAFFARQEKHDFDATFGGWHTDPAPSGIQQTWSGRVTKGGNNSNYGSYESPTFAAYVDSGAAAMDPVRSKAYFRRAYETIIADAPAIWLYEMRPAAGVHKRLRVRGMRADAWWAGIADWTVAPDERLPRDRIGLSTAGGR
jgi:peptide/nickel transport system substrate-binding protein